MDFKLNNIYLTKGNSFAFDREKREIPGKLLGDLTGLVESWVKEYKLTKKSQSSDFRVTINNQDYRVHLFHSYNGWNAALRLLPSKILNFKELGIDSEEVLSICRGTGLVLFCGATGSGKSTTMNSVISSLLDSDILGVTITIEDPVEYLHHKDQIFQREVGTDVESFESGLVDAVRANPTTIVIGEIRDSATALEAVKAGLNGHRVLATLHASNVKEAISRLWAFLDGQGDELLVESLQGIMVQHLINVSGDKQHCLYETLKIDVKTRLLLGRVFSKEPNSSMVQLNHCHTEQKRATLVERKGKLIKERSLHFGTTIFRDIKE